VKGVELVLQRLDVGSVVCLEAAAQGKEGGWGVSLEAGAERGRGEGEEVGRRRED
jgi:hypothetical protein